MLVAKQKFTKQEIAQSKIAVPGTMTSAFLALELWLGQSSQPQAPSRKATSKRQTPNVDFIVVPFDEIFRVVREGKADVGLIIHEGQLTYADDGFQLWEDLGAWWLRETGLPLPLGGNVVRRDLGPAVIEQVARDLKASIVYALEHRRPALEHARQFNRGIGDERTDTFVGMYVNQWTVDYGPRGRQAVQALLDRAFEAGLVPEQVTVDFIG